jgi:hypothetical protein
MEPKDIQAYLEVEYVLQTNCLLNSERQKTKTWWSAQLCQIFTSPLLPCPQAQVSSSPSCLVP